ncbi:ATP-binding cassette domain-containing protein, partial [Bacillus pumilus]|uniref:ATP-binding cassette domain-containing protein n=1 Tax=Bacillus pumilus TaxID=1408 RepID=UPI003C1A6A12
MLSGIDLTIEAGEFVSLMGPSGSGKPTLLNVLSSLDHVSSGSIRIAAVEMTQMKDPQLADFRKKQLGFVFQDYDLL